MIKIELVRFEAQDVITSSVPSFPGHNHKPNKPQQKPEAPAPSEPPVERCRCELYGTGACDTSYDGFHIYNGTEACFGNSEGVHTH